MPHFVIECSESILSTHDGDAITEQVHNAASFSGLFGDNVQVRLNTFSNYRVGNQKQDFIQVFAHILEGRSKEQKSGLSRAVVEKLVEMFPEVETIGIDIIDLEKNTGFTRSL